MMKTVCILLISINMFTLLLCSNAESIVFEDTKQAVISFVGPDQIFQTWIELTSEQKQSLAENHNWTNVADRYKFYYSKSKSGDPEAYAIVLIDILPACDGVHKYCVGIDKEGNILGVKILELSCDRSYMISSASFLYQFSAYNIENGQEKQKRYDAITGATQSTDLTRDVVMRALELFIILKSK
ncbi:MAG: FMN-binding protein [Deltaproteobacteria bacterium]|nr:FMN-binding protein [Deltaproteobacteria bacterium]